MSINASSSNFSNNTGGSGFAITNDEGAMTANIIASHFAHNFENGLRAENLNATGSMDIFAAYSSFIGNGGYGVLGTNSGTPFAMTITLLNDFFFGNVNGSTNRNEPSGAGIHWL